MSFSSVDFTKTGLHFFIPYYKALLAVSEAPFAIATNVIQVLSPW